MNYLFKTILTSLSIKIRDELINKINVIKMKEINYHLVF